MLGHRSITMLAVLTLLKLATAAGAGEVHGAALMGDLERVRSILDTSPEMLNALDKDGRTPLDMAIMWRHEEVTRFLREAGGHGGCGDIDFLACTCDTSNATMLLKLFPELVNERGPSARGKTPLCVAVYHNCKELVDFLLAKGADVNITSDDGETPLHDAALYADTGIIETLTQHKANVDARDNRGSTPLMYAVQRGRLDSVALLLTSGADVNIRLKDSKGPLYYTTLQQFGEYKAVRELLMTHGARLNIYELSALGMSEEVSAMLKESPSVLNLKDERGWSALHEAASNGRDKVIKILLAQKADRDSADGNGDVPLHLASRNGHRIAVELLLDGGINPDPRNSGGRTPLYEAVARAHVDIVDLLLTRGADANAHDQAGKTPLRVAATERPIPVMNCIPGPVDPKQVEAREKPYKEIANLLRKYGAKE